MTLTPSELSSIRATAQSLLPDSCSVVRTTMQADGMGGESAQSVTSTVYPCRVAPLGQTPAERAVADRLSGVAACVVTLPAGADVRAGDSILHGTLTYSVVAVLRRSEATVTRVVCQEAQ